MTCIQYGIMTRASTILAGYQPTVAATVSTGARFKRWLYSTVYLNPNLLITARLGLELVDLGTPSIMEGNELR